jgi:hypothetical protein
MALGAQLQQGCGGDVIGYFGNELLYGSSIAQVKEQIESRWGKSIGRSYSIRYVDEAGDLVEEIYAPKLYKVRTRVVQENYVGQLELSFGDGLA